MGFSMSYIAVATTPNSDRTTRYISAWAEKTIDELGSKRPRFIVLMKEKAKASILESMIKKHNPSLLFLNGHGDKDLVCGHDDEFLLQSGKNERQQQQIRRKQLRQPISLVGAKYFFKG